MEHFRLQLEQRQVRRSTFPAEEEAIWGKERCRHLGKVSVGENCWGSVHRL